MMIHRDLYSIYFLDTTEAATTEKIITGSRSHSEEVEDTTHNYGSTRSKFI